MIARELLVKLGFNIDYAKMDRFKHMIDDTKRKMQSLKHNLAPEVISRFNELKAEHDEQKNWSRQERAEVNALNRLEKQAIREVASIEAEKFKEKQRQLRELQSQARNISRKIAMFGASMVAGFGFSLRSTLKDAEDFKTGKSKSHFTPEQIAEVNKFNQALESTKRVAVDIRNSFVIGMLPALTKILRPLREWIMRNKELIKQRMKSIIEGVGNALITLSSILLKIASAIDFVVQKTVGWKSLITTMIGIGAATWFANVARSIMLTATAVRALSLAIRANPIVMVISGIAAAFAWIVNEMKAFRSGFKTTATLLQEWGGVWEAFGDILERVFGNLSNLIDGFKELNGFKISGSLVNLLNPFSSITGDVITSKKMLVDHAVKLFGGDKEDNLSTPLAIPQYTPQDLQPSSSIMHSTNKRNNITQNNSVNITITAPSGTTEEQQKDLANFVKGQIDGHMDRMITVIGPS